MLKTLYDHFLVLYHTLLPANPSIAADHALKQENEIHQKSSKHTYRNAVIQCAAAIKRRSIPKSISHLSVGTEDEIIARTEARDAIQSLTLTRAVLEPYICPLDVLLKWGYFTAVPDSPGGHQTSIEGKVAKCERCTQSFLVKPKEHADQCQYHWGKPYRCRVNGDKLRVYHCCSRPADTGDGCTQGPHVFQDYEIEDLHARHPFSLLLPPTPDSSTALDVAAIDCEMIYTTGGLRVARVSVVDGSGKEIIDELVCMDPGVKVIDYITRFSGITSEIHEKAVLSLAEIRKSLDSFINTDTILIGHALENDLKTLRIIHHKCIDTALLFPHKAGPPYRRSLKDLAREHLGIVIQAGDATVGHSSVEDAAATLNLVRWQVINGPKPTLKVSPTSPANID